MSKKVDERVVEMRFDNKDFESNVKTTMSTLDRLKAALKLPTSSKSLDGVANAAKNSTSNIAGLGAAVETVNARFSALQVIGMTALSNITTAAMRAGSNMIKSLTLDPIISGFQEYETQLNAVQTILANTQSKGTTIDDVSAALDELNEYADLTIYNFTEMTRNIGTFTAAGVGLEESVQAIKGIANLAAVSGSNSTQAATAMYQLSQALAAGRVSLMDWNSVVNAGMGGELFQNALKRTAENMGYNVDAMIEKYGSFRESLTQGGWLTAEVLTETLAQISGAYTEADLIAQGYTESQAKEIVQLAETATAAATEIKGFTQLMSTVSEAIGSGWATTWKLIFGDFEQAKAFWTGIWNETLSPMIDGMSDARNAVIEGAMDMGGSGGWDSLSKQITDAGVSLDDFQAKLSEVVSEQGGSLDGLIEKYGSLGGAITSGEISADSIIETLKRLASSADTTTASTEDLNEKLVYFQDVVDRVWQGEFKNAPERYQLLADAGYDYAAVQDLVNKTVDGHRLTLEDLSDAQLISIGYTEEEVKQIRALAEEAEKAGTPLNELINNLSKRSGRELFLESLENLLYAVLKPLQAVGNAWNAIFGLDSAQLYGIIEAFHGFTSSLVMDDITVKNLTRTLQGFFSILHIVATFAGNGFAIAFRAINTVLGFFGTNLLGVTAVIGDALTAFDKWITSGEVIQSIIEGIGSVLQWALGPIGDFFGQFAELPAVQTALQAISDFFSRIVNFFGSIAGGFSVDGPIETIKQLKEELSSITWDDVLAGLSSFGSMVGDAFSGIAAKFTEIGPDIIAGLQNGLSSGWESVISFLTDLANKIVEAVKAVLGIHSPSTVFFEIGKNIVEGLINGIKFISGKVAETLRAIVGDLGSVLSEIDWGTILTVAGAAGVFVIFYKIADAFQSFGDAVGSFAGVGEKLQDLVGSFDKLVDAKALQLKAEAVKSLAIGVGILAASVFVLAQLDPAKLWSAVGALTVMGAVLAGLVYVMGNFGKSANKGGGIKESLKQLLDIGKVATLLVSLGTSLLMLSAAMAIIGGMDQGEVIQAGIVIAAFGGLVTGLIAITKISGTKNLDKAGTYVQKIGVALLLMATTAKLMGGMSATEMSSAQEMIAMFGVVVMGLIAVTQLAGNKINSAANFMSKVGTAFLLLGVTARLLGGMSADEMSAAKEMLSAFAIIVMGLIAVTQFAGKSVDQLSDFLLKVSGAFVLLGVAAKILGGMSTGEMIKAGVAIAAFTGVMAALVAITKLGPEGEMAKISTTLLAMSASIAILAGVAVLLGMIDPGNLIKGLAAITWLSLLVAMMTKVTSGAKDVKGTMIGIAAAIGVMAASIAVLSLLDPARVAIATACMSMVMGMFALVVKMGSNVQTSMGVMIAMVAVIAAMAVAIGVLAQMPWQNTLASAAGLSTVLLSLAAACKILSSINSVAPMALVAAGIVTALMAVIAYILVQMNGIDPLGAVANATALSTVLLAFSAVTLILSKIGAGAMAAVQGALAMAVVIAAVTAVLAAIGGINNALEGGLETALDGAIRIMEKIGQAIGSFISGIGVGLSSGLPQIAQNLSLFGVGLTPFITSMKMIDSTIVDSATSLAGAILALTASNFIDGIMNLLTFGQGGAFSGLGEKFSELGSALGNFADATAGIDGPSTAIAAAALANICTAMSGIPSTGGLLEGLFGSQDFSGFASGMASLGAALAAFDTATTGITPERIQPAAEALKSVMDAMSGVPNSGGLLGDLLGGKDYTGFATGMESIGAALKSFYDATSEISDFEKLNTASNALKTVIDVLSTIPNSGGLLGDLLGGKDYTGFATGMESIGTALQNFNSSVTAIEDFEKLNTATGALKTVIETLSTIPAEGGWLDNIFGDGSINYENFSTAMTGVGTALSDYSGSVSELNIDKIAQSITTLRDVINVLRSYSVSNGDIDAGLDNVEKISDLGDALKTYGEKIANVDPAKVAESATAVSNLKDVINNLVGLDSSGIANFQTAINQLAQTNVQGLIDTFSNIDMSSIGANMMTSLAAGISAGGAVVSIAAALIGTTIVTTLTTAGDKIAPVGLKSMTQFASGVTIGGVLVTTAVIAVSAAAAAAAMSSTGQFRNAGLMMASGLASGIRAGGYGVRQAAYNIASSAAQAARDAVRVASPSKVFREIGGYMGEGMVIGLNDYSIAASKAGSELGESAVDGLTKSISTLGDYLNSDLDVNPTIRPVMDLSDVKNGADQINGMLNNVDSLGISHATRIDNMMNSRIQNGSFNDVVNAVDRLRGALNNVGNTTYTVNGVTYDDGTNIAVAVGDLTRAIRLERRV